MRDPLCGHEEGLDDAVHVAGVPKVDQAGLARLRLPSLPQKPRGKRVGLGGPGTLIQHQLDLIFTGFWEILRRQFEMISCITGGGSTRGKVNSALFIQCNFWRRW